MRLRSCCDVLVLNSRLLLSFVLVDISTHVVKILVDDLLAPLLGVAQGRLAIEKVDLLERQLPGLANGEECENECEKTEATPLKETEVSDSNSSSSF